MAVLRGGGVPARGQANQADVKSANNGELRATRRSIVEHREAKKVFVDSMKLIFVILSGLSCIVYSEFLLLSPVNRCHTSAQYSLHFRGVGCQLPGSVLSYLRSSSYRFRL